MSKKSYLKLLFTKNYHDKFNFCLSKLFFSKTWPSFVLAGSNYCSSSGPLKTEGVGRHSHAAA
jgi:hypothetical protein